MFDYVGNKLRLIAKIVCWCGIILSAILGLTILNKETVLLSLLVIGIGSLLSWLGSLTTYAFGDMVQNIEDISNKLSAFERERRQEKDQGKTQATPVSGSKGQMISELEKLKKAKERGSLSEDEYQRKVLELVEQ